MMKLAFLFTLVTLATVNAGSNDDDDGDAPQCLQHADCGAPLDAGDDDAEWCSYFSTPGFAKCFPKCTETTQADIMDYIAECNGGGNNDADDDGGNNEEEFPVCLYECPGVNDFLSTMATASSDAQMQGAFCTWAGAIGHSSHSCLQDCDDEIKMTFTLVQMMCTQAQEQAIEAHEIQDCSVCLPCALAYQNNFQCDLYTAGSNQQFMQECGVCGQGCFEDLVDTNGNCELTELAQDMQAFDNTFEIIEDEHDFDLNSFAAEEFDSFSGSFSDDDFLGGSFEMPDSSFGSFEEFDSFGSYALEMKQGEAGATTPAPLKATTRSGIAAALAAAALAIVALAMVAMRRRTSTATAGAPLLSAPTADVAML